MFGRIHVEWTPAVWWPRSGGSLRRSQRWIDLFSSEHHDLPKEQSYGESRLIHRKRQAGLLSCFDSYCSSRGEENQIDRRPARAPAQLACSLSSKFSSAHFTSTNSLLGNCLMSTGQRTANPEACDTSHTGV